MVGGVRWDGVPKLPLLKHGLRVAIYKQPNDATGRRRRDGRIAGSVEGAALLDRGPPWRSSLIDRRPALISSWRLPAIA